MRKFAIPLSLFTAGGGPAQSAGGPESPPQTPEVWVQTLDQGKTIRDGAPLHAPAEIFMFLGVSSEAEGGPGDHISLELMDNTNKLYQRRLWQSRLPHPGNRR